MTETDLNGRPLSGYADCRALCPGPSSQEDRTLAAWSKKKKPASVRVREGMGCEVEIKKLAEAVFFFFL